MTYLKLNPAPHGLSAALTAGLAAAFLLAAPAHAQRVSLTDLATDHDNIQATVDETNQIVKEGATPVFDCGTIDQPGSYIVVQNIAAVGDCITVTADNVMLDLDGFEISGDGTGSGIHATNLPRIMGLVVQNGAVTNFQNGITLEVIDCTIRNVRAIANVQDGINGGFSCAYLNNMANQNGGDGIFAGVNLFTGTGNIVSGNTANGNGSNGIILGNPSIVTGNVANGNTRSGITVFNASTVSGNTAFENGTGLVGDAGIFVDCPSNVFNNTAFANDSVNISLSGVGCNDVNNLAP